MKIFGLPSAEIQCSPQHAQAFEICGQIILIPFDHCVDLKTATQRGLPEFVLSKDTDHGPLPEGPRPATVGVVHGQRHIISAVKPGKTSPVGSGAILPVFPPTG
jgi:hypothetical protein